jgi:hypothetical protein
MKMDLRKDWDIIITEYVKKTVIIHSRSSKINDFKQCNIKICKILKPELQWQEQHSSRRRMCFTPGDWI